MLDIPNQDLLELLYARGYTIDIITRKDSQFVHFNHQTALYVKVLPYSYDYTFTHEQIRLDCVYDLLKWTGLKVKYTLDY